MSTKSENCIVFVLWLPEITKVALKSIEPIFYPLKYWIPV